MACILKPECNFLKGYFRCLLLSEKVDVEVKAKTMRGINLSRRDRTTQVISYNPWSTRLHPYPSLLQKNEDIPGVEGQAWPLTQAPTPNLIVTTHQHSLPKQQFLNQKNPRTQHG